MIAELRGTVVDVDLTHVTLDVSGIGYHVAVRSVGDFKVNTSAHLYTHLVVRETALDLYGFLNKEELDVFELLLKIPKIGPKSAMQILSQAEIGLLKKAVATEDPSYLSKMSGIGKKSAEKIVAGLKDVFENAAFDEKTSSGTNADSDVIDALMTLGYSQKDAREALQKLPSEVTGTNERIKLALKYLGS